jgi:uncharacterized protein YqjF (DUF2071 family)
MSEPEASPAPLPPPDRSWPLPARPWVMVQTWRDLLFAHWPVASDALRRLIPAGLTLHTFEGQAWLAVTPFVITGLRPRGLPAIPGVSAFPEVNVRTYVTAEGKPGVFFFSLDAGSALAVRVARALYSLPYFRARMTADARGGAVAYATRRMHRGASAAELRAEYRPTGPVVFSTPGTLAAWLTERYCLYAVDRRGGLHRAEIDHPRWPLQPADAEIRVNTMTTGLGFELPTVAPLLHFSARLDVRVWLPESLGTAGAG